MNPNPWMNVRKDGSCGLLGSGTTDHCYYRWSVHLSFMAFFMIDHSVRAWHVGFWQHLRDEINLLEFCITIGSFFYLTIFLTTKLYVGALGLWHVFYVLPMLRPWVRAY